MPLRILQKEDAIFRVFYEKTSLQFCHTITYTYERFEWKFRRKFTREIRLKSILRILPTPFFLVDGLHSVRTSLFCGIGNLVLAASESEKPFRNQILYCPHVAILLLYVVSWIDFVQFRHYRVSLVQILISSAVRSN